MSDLAVNVENLVKEFAGSGKQPIRAVDDLSFFVERGSIFGLLGPNGAGKTTTLRILTTLISPTAGSASVLGWSVTARPVEVRRRISVVIQEHAAELFLTVRDNLLTFARFHGLTGPAIRKKAEEVMDQFELRTEATRKVQDLSGGFRRRVQVAKVFMVDTPLIILDEFSTGMDPILKRSVMERLRGEAGRGRTIILTTQVLTEAEELCDDILIMNHGRAVARGDLHALKLLSAGVYEVAVTFDQVPPGLRAELERRQPFRLLVSGNTVELALKEDEAHVLALVGDLMKRGQVRRIEIGGATLEDIFVELTQSGGGRR